MGNYHHRKNQYSASSPLLDNRTIDDLLDKFRYKPTDKHGNPIDKKEYFGRLPSSNRLKLLQKCDLIREKGAVSLEKVLYGENNEVYGSIPLVSVSPEAVKVAYLFCSSQLENQTTYRKKANSKMRKGAAFVVNQGVPEDRVRVYKVTFPEFDKDGKYMGDIRVDEFRYHDDALEYITGVYLTPDGGILKKPEKPSNKKPKKIKKPRNRTRKTRKPRIL